MTTAEPGPAPSLKALLTSPDPEHPPFSESELRAAQWHPALAIDVLLAQRERWTASVVENRHWGRMLVLLLLWSVLFSLPYSLVLSWRQAWQIAALFLGSVAICLPSLHVTSAYLGLRVHFAQSIAFAAIIAAVACIFSCGFAPILWFLQATSTGSDAPQTVAALSGLLLWLAALAGSLHGVRCLVMARRLDGSASFSIVLLAWLGLLVFIGLRMSLALGLR